MSVDVAPVRGDIPKLCSHLAHEDVDRAIAPRHRPAPDVLVDLRPLDDDVDALGEHEEELELAYGQVGAASVDEQLQFVRADLEVGESPQRHARSRSKGLRLRSLRRHAKIIRAAAATAVKAWCRTGEDLVKRRSKKSARLGAGRSRALYEREDLARPVSAPSLWRS